MDNIEKIKEMEEILNEAQSAADSFFKSIEKLESLKGKIAVLIQYYESDKWMHDFEDSEKGLLPKDLKCGVLSEDAVYSLLCDLEEISSILKHKEQDS